MNLLLLALGTLFTTSSMAGEIIIYPSGAYCQSSKSDLDCLSKSQNLNRISGKVTSVTLLGEIAYRSSFGQERVISPALRVIYKTSGGEDELILGSDSSSKLGITMMELSDSLRERDTKVILRSEPETRAPIAVVLTITK